MNTIYYLTLEDIEFIFKELNSFFVKHNDPIPEFSSSYHHKIESFLARPQDTFDQKDLYPNIFSKAACYLFFINMLHPFMNGNKRMSIMCAYVFLRKNGYIFQVEEDEMYEYAKELSDGHKDHDAEFKRVVDFVKKHSKPIMTSSFFPFDIEEIREFLRNFSLFGKKKS